MSFSKIFDVILQVLTNKNVIFIFVLIILYLNFVFYIMRYKKKIRIPKKKETPVVVAAKKTDNDEDDDYEEEDDDEYVM